MSESKTCIECGVTYPATPTYFHKSKDGYHARCRKCRNKKIRKERKGKRNKKLDEIEKGGVGLFVASARIGGANIPHSSELLETLMEYFGGVRGFGNAFMKQYYDSPVGGAFRTKMLESVMRLVQNNTAMGGAKKPFDLMTDEELEAEIRRQVLEAALTMKLQEKKDELQRLPVVHQETGVPVREVPPGPADGGLAGGAGD